MRPLVRIQSVVAGLTSTGSASSSSSLRLPRRAFVDMTFVSDEVNSSNSVSPALDQDVSDPNGGSTGEANGGSAAYPQPRYVYPLDVNSLSFRLYGEAESAGDATGGGRLFSSSKNQSYDPALLYQELRAQESGAAAVAVDTQALLKADEEDMDAVMREGRDKQGAASAAAVAAAVIEVSQTARVDGIAMVPNHPLPVVFPKQDGGVAPRSFNVQSGPTVNQVGQARRQARVDGAVSSEDPLVMSEVMEGDGRIEGYSLHRASTMRVTVTDEPGRLHRIRRFKAFDEVPHVLPRLTEAITLCGADCPTLLQSAALPLLLEGRDLLAQSPHGSGRALAYAIPAIQIALKQRWRDPKGATDTGEAQPKSSESTEGNRGAMAAPSVLVLCCTKQTVRQRHVVVENLMEAVEENGSSASVAKGYESFSAGDPPGAALGRDVELLVATVDFVLQQCERGQLSLHRVRFLAVDGVVESSAFIAGLREVVSVIRRNKTSHQACVWGFKSSPTLQEVADLCLAPHHMTLTVTREVQATTQARQVLYLIASKTERLTQLQRLFEQRVIQKREQTLICCGYREVAETLAAFLSSSLSAPPSMVKFIHSGVRERRRLAVLNDFHKGDVRILVATGTVLQHVDVAGVNHLISFDLPASTRTYERRLHFLAPSGTSHVFLTPHDSKMPVIARYVEKITGHRLSGDLLGAVQRVECDGGDNDWNLPSSLHTAAGTAFSTSRSVAHKWRVRGKQRPGSVAQPVHGGEDEDVAAPPTL